MLDSKSEYQCFHLRVWKRKEEEKKAIKDLVSPSAQESAEDVFIYLFIWTEGESETARDKDTEKNSSDQNDYNGLNNYDCVIFKYLFCILICIF